MNNSVRYTYRVLALVLAASLLAACSFGSSLPQLSADQIKQRSADKMSALTSLHFVIELSGHLTYIDPGRVLALKRAEGDVATPNNVQATLRTRTLGTTTDLNVVGIGATQWARNPLSGRWETLPPEYGTFDIGALFSGETGVAGLLRNASFEMQPEVQQDGQPQYVLATTTQGAQLSGMTSGMITSGTIDATLYIDGTSFAVTQIKLIERDTDPAEPTTWLISLSAFDQPVTITPPITQ